MKLCSSAALIKVYPLILVSTLLSKANPALAQITPDNTLGAESSTVNPRDEASDSIQGGAVRGQNLFHSFEDFNVDAGRGTYFANPDAVDKIFSRVTGGNESNILGTLGVDGAADLYLINPNGIVFGENARLDVQGSFTATTADAIEFGEGGLFSAIAPGESLLTISVPLGLQFGSTPGSIVNRSFVPDETEDVVGLQVPDGKNLTLVGGDILFDGGVATATSGNIYLGGLSETGIVSFKHRNSLGFSNSVAKADINLTNFAYINVVGTGSGSGSVKIDARNVNIEAGESNFSFIEAGIATDSIETNLQVGDITINATDNLKIDRSLIVVGIFSEGVGNAGNLNINVGSLELTNGGQISNIILGEGNLGIVEIIASGDITVDGKERNSQILPSGITSLVSTDAQGDVGGIIISTANLNVINQGRISSSIYGQGNAEAINITAKENIFIEGIDKGDIVRADSKGNLSTGTIFPINLNNLPNGGIFSSRQASIENSEEDISSNLASQVDVNGVGNTGGVSIDTANLNITNGGKIDASTFGQGNTGGIEIIASGDITVDEQDLENNASSITSQVDTNAGGNSGDINILTSNLDLTNGGKIDASTFGRGNGGKVEITALEDINADGSDFKDIPSGVTSQVDTSAVGNADGVFISTTNLNLLNGARIDSSTFGQGNAGTVNIDAKNNIFVDGEYTRDFIIFNQDKNVGGIFSAVNEGATGDANGIKITARNLILTNAGTVSNSTFGQGNAGNTTIEVDSDISIVGEDLEGFFSGIFSRVDQNAVGNAGNVTISTADLKLIDGGRIDLSTLGKGDAGAVNITALENIIIDGIGSIEEEPSLIDSRVELGAEGNAGGVVISASNLNITNSGRIDVSTFGQGNAGELTINADLVSLDRDSLIVSRSESDFDAGNITLNVADSLHSADSFISTSSIQSSGGNLAIAASDIQLRGDSNITTDINSGKGSGGNIDISANSVLAFDDSDIFAFAADGQGGNISLDTPAFFAENFTLNSLTADPDQLELNNRVDVNATGGVSGAVDIPDVSFIQNSLSELPDNSIDTNELVANSCVVPSGGRGQGNFIITGGESLPVRPGDDTRSSYPTGEVRNIPEDDSSSWQPGDPIVEPQGAYRLANGQLVLSRECSQQ